MADIKGGMTNRYLARLGLTPTQWQAGLRECAEKNDNCLPPAHLTKEVLHPSSLAMLVAAQRYCEGHSLEEITEPVLLLSALAQLTPATQQLFHSATIDVEAWLGELELLLMPAEPVRVFSVDDTAMLIEDSFTAGAKKVLHVMRDEAEALGYPHMDPRHLTLALLTYEGGATQYGLYQQGLGPRKIREALALNLKVKARPTRSIVPLQRAAIQPVLQTILTKAGELAGSEHTCLIAEKHLLAAFLTTENMACSILEDEKVDLERLLAAAERHDPTDENDADDLPLADIGTIRQRLLNRLVGQEAAIERILPAVQRMQFGFSIPERPVGVFLFCGQSGSGKTEMAKELARAVYGSEENLIYLEMGQFNSPESMNIFVGSPPGYVGYGEGKLTNGLRDKPRAVVLFDEVEKAHPRVLDALLRFLDEGRIDDPAGPVRDGSQCIVILTSNVGATELSRLAKEIENKPGAMATIRARLRQEFEKQKFRVEFLNRVDELILFRTLNTTDYTMIAERLLKKNLERLDVEKQVRAEVSPEIPGVIGAYCDEIGEGARAAARLIQSLVINPIIDFIACNALTPPITVAVRAAPRISDATTEPCGIVELRDRGVDGIPFSGR
jgi:ATP-dependent Clp protease ATP-binding subunit ClpC